MYKFLVLLAAILMLVSCDTGYNGNVEPENEVFNYTYPLKKGNVWEYLVTERKTNFSNPAVAALVGADSLLYSKIKYYCSNDTAWFAGMNLYQIDTFVCDDTTSISAVDTSTYTKTTSYYRNNTSEYYLEYGRKIYPQGTINIYGPIRFLKYNIYPGDSWEQTNDNIVKKIDSFLNLNNQRVCLIKTTEYSQADTTNYDEYFSKRGLEKIYTKRKVHATDENGIEVTYDEITTQELIRTNAK